MSETLTTPEQPNFQASIDAITSRRLTPENLEEYADGALNDLIGVVDKVVQNYKCQPVVMGQSPKDEERSAFAYYGIEAEAIEATLDHIADAAEAIHGLDAVVSKITIHTDKIITPPTRPELAIVAGSGTFHENQYVPRLKTLLFMLGSKYDIDVTDPEKCTVLTGEINEYMMRNEPYRLVSLPTLNRNVLVCDEESNATFVFDTNALQAAEISQDRLIMMDKDELRDFLNEHPEAGRRLTHSKYYTERLASLLEDIPAQGDEITVSANSARFLALKEVPDEFMTRNVSAKALGVSHEAIKRAADALGDELGTLTMAKFKNGPAPVYSPEQRSRMKRWLDEHGYTVPQIPDDYRTVGTLPNELPVSFYTVRKAIEELGDSLGERMRVRVGNNITDALSPEQVSMIRDRLIQTGKLVEDQPEGYLAPNRIAVLLNTSPQSVALAIKENAEMLGETKKVRIGKRITDGYSPEQQQIIRTYLEARGVIGQAAPDGYLTKFRIVETYGYSEYAVKKALVELEDSLGDVLVAKTHGRNASVREVYSPEQQASIIEWMRDNGYKPTKSAIGSVATSKLVETTHA